MNCKVKILKFTKCELFNTTTVDEKKWNQIKNIRNFIKFTSAYFIVTYVRAMYSMKKAKRDTQDRKIF